MRTKMLIAVLAAACPGLETAGAAVVEADEREWSAPPPLWEGTWQGTIGTLPVHVCLNSTPYENRGAYYYDRHKQLISLDLDQASQHWIEGEGRDNTGPRWKIATAGSDQIAGTWTDRTKSLPIALKRIGGPSQDFEGPCGGMAFHRPRVSPPRLTSKAGEKDGVGFTSWTFKPGAPWSENVEVTTFTLDRPGAGVAKVNATLKTILPKADGTGEWLDCMAGNANAHGADGGYLESMEPTLITDRWLGVNHHSDSYCGGNHPNTITQPRAFDLISGTEIDPFDWFDPNAVHVEQYQGAEGISKTLTGAFVKELLKGWKPEDPDCEDALRSREYWTIGIARGALIFTPDLPRVVMACSETISVPFSRLQPWLSAAGKAAVATLPR